MAYTVRYSNRAFSEYEEILDYLVFTFGLTIAAKVDRYFEEVIDQISINPRLYPYSDKNKNIRRCVVSSQTTLYYRFDGEFIELVSFRGNLKNPETIQL